MCRDVLRAKGAVDPLIALLKVVFELPYFITRYRHQQSSVLTLSPRAGSGIVRTDPLCFLAGCHKWRLNQALSVLSVSLGFF